MHWGFAGPWYGQLLKLAPPPGDGPIDPLLARLRVLREFGLTSTGDSLNHVAALEQSVFEQLAGELQQHDQGLVLYAGYRYLETTPDRAAREAEALAAHLDHVAAAVNCRLVMTTPRAGHRFDRELPVAAKLDLLATALGPLAEVCAARGLPFGIENHGDYYVSDLVQLCRSVPHLGLFLDTGNTYLIGEQPLPAFELAAPYVVGTHFKDHRVRPMHDARPLHFEVAGAVLGEGDVPLRECLQFVAAAVDEPQKLVMEIEMVVPDGVDPVDGLHRSVAFVKALEAEVLR